MAQQQDYVALEWVKGEIGQTLKQAQQSLEAFAEKPKDRTTLRFCLAHVHQIKGSLQMVEVHALVQLAADMEALILALEENRISDSIEALQVLMQAILQLPLWLEQLSCGQSDLTLNTLPLCNQLRAACGQAPLTDGKPPVLKLPAPRPPLPAGDLLERDSAGLDGRLHRMRLALQKGLSGIVRGQEQDIQTHLDYLSRVFSALSRLCQQAPLYPLWQVASALAEGLKNGVISTTPTLHILLRKLDHELKLLIERGVAGINQNPPEDLLSALLLQVASAANGSPRLDALKAEYGLDAPQDAQTLTSNAAGLDHSSPDALRAVVSALCEDLRWVKDELDLFARSRGDNVALLNSLLVPLKQVESTLSLLGFAQAQKTIQTQIDTLHALTSGQKTLAHELLLDMAGALLYVESSLIGMVMHDGAGGLQPLPEAINLPHCQQLVLQESLSRLAEVKDAFIAFINADWKREPLEVVPELLSEVSGALHLASFERAGKILAFCKGYVEQRLLAYGQMPPDWQSLDRLADAISAVEYCLERLRLNPPEQGEALLTLAEQSLQVLASETAADDAPLALPSDEPPLIALPETDELTLDSEPVTSSEPPPLSIGEVLAAPASPINPPAAEVPLSLASDEPALIALPETDEFTLDSEPVTSSEPPPLSIGEVLAAPTSPINPPAAEVPLSLLPPPADEEPLDEELLEVFVEELDEVLDALHKLLPAWQNATEDRTLQSEIRRAFHTLKGSGRMVRALIIGELAWSVENLLNRVLDGSREASEDVLSLVLEVSKLLPELRDEFASSAQRQRDDVDRLAIRAHKLAKNEPPAAALIDEARIDSAPAEQLAPLAIDQASPPDPACVFIEQPEQIAKDQQLDAWLEMQLTDFAPSQQKAADEPAQEENTWAAFEPPAEPEEPSAERIEKARPIQSEEALTSSEPPALDAELLEIFKQEAEQHLAVLADFVADCVQQLPQPIPDSLQSALHTLKGSANIAGILSIAQIASALEKFTETLKINRLAAELTEASLFGRAGSLLRQGLLQLQTAALREIPGSDELLRDIAQLQEQRLQEQRLSALHLREADSSEEASPDTQRSKLLAEGMDLLLEAGLLLEQWKDSQSVPADLKAMLAQWAELADTAKTISPPFEALCRAQLALYRAVAAGELPAGAAFFEQTQKTHELLLSMLDNVALLMEVAAEPEQIAALQALLSSEPAEDLPLSSEQSEEPPAAEIIDQVAAVEQTPPEPAFEVTPPPVIETSISAESEDDALDEELLDIFLEEGSEILDQAASQLQRWIEQPQEGKALLPVLQRQLHTLKGSARATGFLGMGHLAHALEFLYEDLAEGRLAQSQELLELLQQGHDHLALMLEALQDRQTPPGGEDVIRAIARFRGQEEEEPQPALPAPVETPIADSEPPSLSLGKITQITDQAVAVEQTPPEPAFEVTPPPAIETSARPESEDDALDEELLDIFLEEGSEILHQAASQLQRWMEQPQEGKALLPVLQRQLHTLKGSARATGFLGMGHLAHALEFLYEDLAEGRLLQSQELLELLQQGHDHLALMLEALQDRQTPPDGEDVIRAIARFRGQEEEEPQPALPAPVETPIPSREQPSLSPGKITQATEPPATSTPATTSGAPSDQLGKVLPFSRRAAPAKTSAPDNQEQVRIAANKLDSFSNLAGEISIFRARIEQQVGDFALTLNEMETTIERVRRQLRQLDIETQAKTLSSVEVAAGQSGEDFDPLEMDRHSQLQQLARALFESATDLLDLKQDLTAQSRDAQTLLLQQARVSSELQESLMQTRLVRFERVVPRLSRIVRQLSRELDKKVELSVDNAQSELDRILLEHLNAPLEHMLRNAIDHGIESSAERLKAGKPAAGHIRLSLTRDGGDILLTLEDDGRGIDLEKVRRKAIERGLAQEDDRLSEQEIRQFVLQAGFSTATKVSETSGRGIGMDVVQAEIRRAGGSLSIHSSQGGGTRFTIRLPFTVSVSRALMVRTGDDLYALPLATVEGVVRLSADELANQYAQPTPAIRYAGQNWTLYYVGDLLGNGQKPKLVGHSLPLPVILVKSAEHYLAVQVDSLAGAREIVVKGLSHPFGSIPGVSGATILGDGKVVVILDLPTLLRKRQQQLLIAQNITPAATSSDRPLLIMVVDDSITVRKVTSRLLERNGMNVLTAKDGVEAIALLQEHKPDLMLLDIEMPRMDGFEVASLVRHSEAFKELPIIMITSRTGTKHRERGLSLGVNDYLGKPYQDAQLLGRIEQLTQRRQHA
ncbi:Hpt domain-containing protein [Ventosimonas gracilis]|nr:Hpt domain-containing protein [Ventosimonas gracilis]